MRFELGHDAWTDGHRHVVLWESGQLSVFEDETLAGWLTPAEPPVWAHPAGAIRQGWEEQLGWPRGALDAAGLWHLAPDGAHALLHGPPVPEPVFHRAEVDDRGPWPRFSQRLSTLAHLRASPAGTLVIDPGRGLVQALERGIAFKLRGVHEEWGLQAVAVPGGILVHAAFQHRSGELLHLGDDGTIRHLASPYGFSCPMFFQDGRVHAILPQEGLLEDGPSGHALVTLDPARARAGQLELEVHAQLPYGGYSASLAGDAWVVNDGYTLIVFRRTSGRWLETSRLAAPKGDPTRLAGPPRLDPGQPLRWRGPAGPFELRSRVCNIGQNHAGAEIEVALPPAVSIDAIHLGETRSRVKEADGALRASFPHAPLLHRQPLELLLQGRVAGPAEGELRFTARSHAPVDPEHPRDRVRIEDLGALRLVFEVEAALCLVRGDDTLPLDPGWVATLADRGLLDREARAPDLSRWLRRALSRCRVESLSEAPERVQAEWLRLSAADRSASSASGIPAYKLESGSHWCVTAEEAARIADTLGPGHPLGAFAAGGGFVVRDLVRSMSDGTAARLDRLAVSRRRFP